MEKIKKEKLQAIKIKKLAAITVLSILFTFFCSLLIPQIVDNMDLFTAGTKMNEKRECAFSFNNRILVEQEFSMPYERFYGVEVFVSSNDNDTFADLTAGLYEDGELVDEWAVSAGAYKSGMFLKMKSGALAVTKYKTYTLKLSGTVSGGELYIWKSNESVNEGQGLYCKGKKNEGTLIFNVLGRGYEISDKTSFLLILFCFSWILVYMAYTFWTNRDAQDMKDIGISEWIFAAVLILSFAFLISQGGDLSTTIKHSEDLIRIIYHGNFTEFYTIVAQKAMSGGYFGWEGLYCAANYHIGLYLALSIIIFPVMLFQKLFVVSYSSEFILQYVTLVLVVLYLCSCWLFVKLLEKIGVEKNKRRVMAYIYLTSIMFLFSTVGFGQLDIIPIIFILWGLLCYIDKKYYAFAALLGIAVALKSFALFILVPLVLSEEKNLLGIIKKLALGVSFVLLNAVTFGRDAGYQMTKEYMGETYQFLSRLFNVRFGTGFGELSVFLLIFCLVCIWAYHSETENWRAVIIYPLSIFSAFIVFVGWHPQWVASACPFLIMALCFVGADKTIFYCNIIFELLFIIISNVHYERNADNYMVNWGILPSITGRQYNGVTIREMILSLNTYSFEALLTMMTAVLLGFAFFSVKKLMKLRQEDIGRVSVNRWFVWGKMALGYMYILFVLVCYFYAG